MPRTKKLNPTQRLEVHLPQDLVARVLGELYSEVESRVPYGAWSKFIEQCIREHYDIREKDLRATEAGR